MSQRDVTDLVGHNTSHLTFSASCFDHSPVYIHWTTGKSEGVDVSRIDDFEIVIKFGMLKLRRDAGDQPPPKLVVAQEVIRNIQDMAGDQPVLTEIRATLGGVTAQRNGVALYDAIDQQLSLLAANPGPAKQTLVVLAGEGTRVSDRFLADFNRALVLAAIADEMDVHLGLPDSASAYGELLELGMWLGDRPAGPSVRPAPLPEPAPGQALLSTWRQLLGTGRMEDGEPYLAGTARPPRAYLSKATADEVGVPDGGSLRVTGERGSVTVPVVVTDIADRVVWLPANAHGCDIRRDLGATAGQPVALAAPTTNGRQQ